MTMKTTEQRRVCTRCQRELPITDFERFPGGTRRYVCRHCKYLYYSKPAKIRWILKTLS